MAMTSDAGRVDVDRAQITRTPDGTVRVDDPDSPLIVAVRVDQSTGRPHLVGVTVTARGPDSRISAAALARLPLAQLLFVAAAQGAHPDERLYRQLARPKPSGQRHWDPGHWQRVLTVYEWAATSGRPGGGAQAVADLWGVALDPTAYRWVAHARTVTGPE